MIALGAAAGAVLALALVMIRAFVGPTLYDRAWAAISAALKAAVVLAALAVLAGRTDLVEAALGLVASGFVLSAAIMRYFRARSFQPSLARQPAIGDGR